MGDSGLHTYATRTVTEAVNDALMVSKIDVIVQLYDNGNLKTLLRPYESRACDIAYWCTLVGVTDAKERLDELGIP